MNLQQLEYIVAVDHHRNFAKAAESCFVTQPTLSMMIKNLETELGIIIFDRSKHPVMPTELGKVLIDKARTIIYGTRELKETVKIRKKIIDGDFAIGIIPTLSTYLIPIMLSPFTMAYPDVNLVFMENTTEVLIDKLVTGKIDVAILATPLNTSSLIEMPLFYEEFMVYSANASSKKYLLPEDLNPEELWLLEEGHCLRSQIINLCELRKKTNKKFYFQTGNLEMLKALVRNHHGITILPELATLTMSQEEKNKLNRFAQPSPVREISLALHRNFVKIHHVEALKKTILECIPKQIKEKQNFKRIDI